MNVKYTKEVLESVVKDSKSITEIIRKLGKKFSGGLHGHLTRKIKKFDINVSHFSRNGCNKGKIPINKRCWREILIEKNSGFKEKASRLRKALMESGREYKCEECGIIPIWNNKPKNLRFLCPNCHSQTSTFGTLNATMLKQEASSG